MKKAILLSTLTTILTLSLAGCGSTGGLEDSVGVQNSTAPTGPIAPVIAESLVPTECPESGPADDLAISMGNEAICDLGPVQFSLSLPETWDYEIRNLTFAGTTTTDAIIFWNIAYPEDTFTLVYAPVPGICGTGVTSEELTLANGMKVWQHTEEDTEKGTMVMADIFFEDVPGSYVASPSETMTTEVWNANRDALLSILGTAQIGRKSVSQQAAIDAAKAQYTGAYDQVYATYDVTSGAWTVSFSKSAAGAKTDRLVVDAAGKVMAAGK